MKKAAERYRTRGLVPRDVAWRRLLGRGAGHADVEAAEGEQLKLLRQVLAGQEVLAQEVNLLRRAQEAEESGAHMDPQQHQDLVKGGQVSTCERERPNKKHKHG